MKKQEKIEGLTPEIKEYLSAEKLNVKTIDELEERAKSQIESYLTVAIERFRRSDEKKSLVQNREEVVNELLLKLQRISEGNKI